MKLILEIDVGDEQDLAKLERIAQVFSVGGTRARVIPDKPEPDESVGLGRDALRDLVAYMRENQDTNMAPYLSQSLAAHGPCIVAYTDECGSLVAAVRAVWGVRGQALTLAEDRAEGEAARLLSNQLVSIGSALGFEVPTHWLKEL